MFEFNDGDTVIECSHDLYSDYVFLIMRAEDSDEEHTMILTKKELTFISENLALIAFTKLDVDNEELDVSLGNCEDVEEELEELTEEDIEVDLDLENKHIGSDFHNGCKCCCSCSRCYSEKGE